MCAPSDLMIGWTCTNFGISEMTYCTVHIGREAESRFEDGQRHIDELDNQVKHCREQLKAVRDELSHERKTRKRYGHSFICGTQHRLALI